MTPKEASKQDNELNVYVNVKLKAQHSRKYPAISVGDKVPIYRKRKPFDTSHYSVWSDAAYTVEDISHSHGLTCYSTSNKHRPFLKYAILNSTSSV